MNKNRIEEILEYKDGRLFWKETKGRRVAGREAGWLADTGYRLLGLFGKDHKEHRVIFFMHHGYFPKYVDHINGVKTDNRIENLRECSASDNLCNQSKNKRNTSGYKNVYYHKKNKKWYVRIAYKKKDYIFGYFDDLEFAALVAEEAREKYHGEFARHS
jgi:hypothetical protein